MTAGKRPGRPSAECAALVERLRHLGVGGWEIIPTSNASTFLSVYPPDANRPGRLRVHQCFAEAPDEILRAIVRYIQRDGRADLPAIRAYAEAALAAASPPRSSRAPRLRSGGTVYDLHQMLQKVAREHFPSHPLDHVRITYGRNGAASSKGRRSIRFGTYNYAHGLVTIHPRLDAEDVPREFVEFVIFHELIHAVLPRPPMVNGRRVVHDREFRRIEEAHPYHGEAARFSREFLRRLAD